MSETITIDGVYGSFTANADGTVNHALPLGELTLTGSVSGQSFTRTIGIDTTDVYVMPENCVLWYGNIVKSLSISDKVDNSGYVKADPTISNIGTKYSITLPDCGLGVYGWSGVLTDETININNINSLHIRVAKAAIGRYKRVNNYPVAFAFIGVNSNDTTVFGAATINKRINYIQTPSTASGSTVLSFSGDKSLDISSLSGDVYVLIGVTSIDVGQEYACVTQNDIEAIWFE